MDNKVKISSLRFYYTARVRTTSANAINGYTGIMLGLFFEKNLCILLEERVKVRSERVLIGGVRNPIHSPAHWACYSARRLLSLPELQS